MTEPKDKKQEENQETRQDKPVNSFQQENGMLCDMAEGFKEVLSQYPEAEVSAVIFRGKRRPLKKPISLKEIVDRVEAEEAKAEEKNRE